MEIGGILVPDTQKNLEFSFGDRPMTHGPLQTSGDPRTAVVEMPIAIPSIIVLKKTAVMFLGLGIGRIFQLFDEHFGRQFFAKRWSVHFQPFLRLLEELSFDAYTITACNKNPE